MTPPVIHTLDLQFLGAPHAIASFLLLGPDGPVLIEAGPGSTVHAMTQALAGHGLRPADVRHVLVTHIHLDHAGAAGWWAGQGATVYVHHAGAPHLVAPERLQASASRIYGDMMQPLWGEFLPSPAENVRAIHDGEVIEAGGLRISAIETPGHARHHLAFEVDGVAFTGDVAGVRRPGSNHIRIPTPPPEFDLAAWEKSVSMLRSRNFDQLYLTHFGAVDAPGEHLEKVAALVPEYSGRARLALLDGLDRDGVAARIGQWEELRLLEDGVPQHDWPVYGSLAPVDMNVDGLLRYWRKQGMA